MPWHQGNRSDPGRRQELPADWPRLRLEILDRDAHRCVWPWRGAPASRQCGQAATDVDHVRRGDDHRPANLQSLCGYHHQQKTAKEAAEARAEAQKKLRHPPMYGKHPGLR